MSRLQTVTPNVADTTSVSSSDPVHARALWDVESLGTRLDLDYHAVATECVLDWTPSRATRLELAEVGHYVTNLCIMCILGY